MASNLMRKYKLRIFESSVLKLRTEKTEQEIPLIKYCIKINCVTPIIFLYFLDRLMAQIIEFIMMTVNNPLVLRDKALNIQ